MSWPPPLSLSEFYALRRLFNDAAGLWFDPSALPVFQQRLASRLPLHELSAFRDYLQLLQRGTEGGEMAAALDLVTAGETYFFRHAEQLSLLAHTILPAVAAANGRVRHLCIWSAGCSSGEEAYTAAILVQESGLFDGWHVRVLGSDLSQERIEHARQGCYFVGAFRSTDESIRRRYFVSSEPSRPARGRGHPRIWQVEEQTRQLCQFSTLNLLRPERDVALRNLDIILCRNVLLYLDERARVQVLQSLYERLAPGGFLLLGHSESLKFVDTPFDLISLHQDLAFQKRPASGRLALARGRPRGGGT